MNKIKIFKNDIILVSVILVVALISFLFFRFTLKSGEEVAVSVNGSVVFAASLKTELEKEFVTEYGKNTLIIKEGTAAIKFADCPDKICVEHRAISKVGETVVCLPHKLVLEITQKD